MTPCVGCGAEPGVIGGCRDVFDALLAAEQADPQLYAWHGAVVPAYLLQHPSEAVDRFRDQQFRVLQLFRARGLEGLHRFAAGQRRRNSHRVGGPPRTDDVLDAFEPIPERPPPTSFAVTVQHLPGRTGGFTDDGYEAYGSRLEQVVDATLSGWRTGSD